MRNEKWERERGGVVFQHMGWLLSKGMIGYGYNYGYAKNFELKIEYSYCRLKKDASSHQ